MATRRMEGDGGCKIKALAASCLAVCVLKSSVTLLQAGGGELGEGWGIKA